MLLHALQFILNFLASMIILHYSERLFDVFFNFIFLKHFFYFEFLTI